jgi:hypothetical protein
MPAIEERQSVFRTGSPGDGNGSVGGFSHECEEEKAKRRCSQLWGTPRRNCWAADPPAGAFRCSDRLDFLYRYFDPLVVNLYDHSALERKECQNLAYSVWCLHALLAAWHQLAGLFILL